MHKSTRRLFSLDASRALAFVEANPWIWERSTQRQERIRPFQHTLSALVLYNEGNALSYIPKCHPEMEPFFEIALPALSAIQKAAGRGYLCKVILAKLKAGGEVRPHFDKGWPLAFEHRFHWVLSTNPQVSVHVSGQDHHFALNEIWEIDNRSEHCVYNQGETDRVHMIVDYVPEPGPAMHYWQPYESGSVEDLFFQAVDRARAQWGSANNPLY